MRQSTVNPSPYSLADKLIRTSEFVETLPTGTHRPLAASVFRELIASELRSVQKAIDTQSEFYGWFPFTGDHMAKVLPMFSSDQREKIVSKLKKSNHIEMHTIGVRKKTRFCRIKWDSICHVLDEKTMESKPADPRVSSIREYQTKVFYSPIYKQRSRDGETPPAATSQNNSNQNRKKTSMGFGYTTQFETTKNKTPLEVDFVHASRLRNTITKTGVYLDRFNRNRDANEFRMLRESYTENLPPLEKLLDWYLPKMEEAVKTKNSKIPIAYSAKQFRSATFIQWVVSLMEKDLAKQKQNSYPITPEIKSIIDFVRTTKWPKGSLDQLPQAIASTHGFLKRVHKSLATISKTGDRRLALTAATLLGNYAFAPSSVTKRHFVSVQKQVAKWEAWSGDLSMFVISESSKHFETLGRDAMKKCGGSVKWESIKEAIAKELSDEG